MIATVAVMAAFSLFVALLFAGMGAPDVAFVEAVLGSAFVGVLLLVLTPLGDPQPELAGEPVPVGADGVLPVAHVRAEVERGVGVDAGAAVPVGHGPLHAVAVAGGLQPLAPGEHEELPPHLRKSGTSRSSESSKVTWRGGCWTGGRCCVPWAGC